MISERTTAHAARWRALECADLSALSAGDLSPSNAVVAGVRRAAERGAVWLTGQPNGQSGDKSPHSKA